jgi:hypothetical protein
MRAARRIAVALLLAAVVGASASARGLPQAGTIGGTLRFPLGDTELFTARSGSLFALVTPPRRSDRVTVLRQDRDGTVTTRPMRFDLASYLWGLSAGPDGLYAGTCVIHKFSAARDQLLRIDAKTLTVRARVFFPGTVQTAVEGSRLWASIGDGEVVRLDPRRLAVEARRRVVSEAAALRDNYSVSQPAIGLGSLWVVTGNKLDLELVRLDPGSLAVRSRTRMKAGHVLAQTIERVVADRDRVYLVGSSIAAVDAHGRIGRPILEPDLEAAEISGTGLVGVTNATTALVRLDARGRIRARTALRDAGGRLAVSGNDAWFLGNAGRGNGLVHIRLTAARLSS